MTRAPRIVRHLLAIALISLVGASLGAQNAKPPSSAELALIQVNAGLVDALRSGDTATLGSSLASDLVFTDASGAPQSRAQLIAAIGRGYRVQAGTPEAVSARVDGNLGLISYQSKYVTDAGDSVVAKTSAVYVLRAGHWQLTSQSSTGAPVRRAAVIAPAPVTPPATVITPSIPTILPGRGMSARAAGSFDPDVKPLAAYNTSPAAQLGRFSIDKKFHGDLEATSKGEMLSAGNPVSGNAGYVAVEHVTGTLNGKRGSFSLMHSGTITGGAQSLTVVVVPGSGTGELAGITGTMNIVIDGAKHSYQFDYSLPGAK